jgi:two-component system NarL family response regulator
LADGKPDREIAMILDVSQRTVSKHVENILLKMGAKSRTEAAVRAVRDGMLG